MTCADPVPGPTPAMLADPSLGACRRMRPGCTELGPWRPFYRGYVCGTCLSADQADVRAHRSPPGDCGHGTLFRKESEPAAVAASRLPVFLPEA